MGKTIVSTEKLLAEIEQLRTRLAESEQIIESIRSGAVDGIVVSDSQGDQVFTLQGAGHTYKALIERMGQGAAIVNQQGHIHYANQALCQLLKTGVSVLVGSSIYDYVEQEHRPALDAAFLTDLGNAATVESVLAAADASNVPVQMNVVRVQVEEVALFCVVFADLTDQMRRAEVLEQAVAERTRDLARANRDTHESEWRFRAIFEQAAVGVAQIETPTGRFVRVNQRYCDVVGLTPDEMTVATFMEITHPDDLQEDLDNMERLKAGEIREFSMEKRYCRRDGEIVWVDLTVSPMWQPGESPNCHVAVVVDITERKHVEAERQQLVRDMGERIKELKCMYAVAESIRRHDTLEDVFRDVVALIPPGWQYPEIARGKVRFDGNEYVSQPFEETEWRQSSDVIVAGEKRGVVEVYYLEKRPCLDEGLFLREERHLIDGIATAVSAAIERKLAEQALRESEASLRKAQEIAHLGFWEFDWQSGQITWSDEMYRIFGMEPQEIPLTYDQLLERVHPDDRGYHDKITAELAAEGKVTFEYRLVRPDGEIRWVWGQGESICDRDGNRVRNVGTVQGITERKLAEEALERRHRELKALYRVSEAAIVDEPLDTTLETIVRDVSLATNFPIVAIEFYDESRHVMEFAASTGMPDHGKPLPLEVPASQTLSGVVAQTGEPVVETRAMGRPEYTFEKLRELKVNTFVCVPMLIKKRIVGTLSLANPNVVSIDENVLPLATNLANSIAGVVERKRAEEEVESVARFPSENPHPVLRIAKSGEILYANEAAERLVSSRRGAEGDMAPVEWQRKTADAIQHDASRQMDAVHEGKIFSFAIAPVVGAGYANWYGRDITERKRAQEEARRAQEALFEQQRSERKRVEAELERLREELVRQTRLAAIGQVSGSIAHDLRNPLGAVRNAAYYLRKHALKDQPKTTQFLEIIDRQLARAEDIIGNLLVMTRTKEPLTSEVDLRSIVEDTLEHLEGMAKVRLTIATDPDPFLFHADAEQFRQVAVNLALNAVQAMNGDGELLVEAYRDESANIIVFRDTGPGIAADVRETLFEPLVTTKAAGTGLGLSICRQIVEQHGGTIETVEDDKAGAAFRVSLPRRRNRKEKEG